MVSPTDPSSGDAAPSQAIIQAVAAREGVDMTDIEPPAYEPLYSVVDPGALDALFETPDAGSATEACVCLEYEGYDVVVSGDGAVDVSEQSDSPPTDWDGLFEFPIDE